MCCGAQFYLVSNDDGRLGHRVSARTVQDACSDGIGLRDEDELLLGTPSATDSGPSEIADGRTSASCRCCIRLSTSLFQRPGERYHVFEWFSTSFMLCEGRLL
jgi:hypothetical protein